jgi:hypothetical protein
MARLHDRQLLGSILSFAVLLGLGVVSACSEDSSEPTNDGVWDRLAGTWDARRAEVDDETVDLGSGSFYWYFNDLGSYCEKSRNAYGYASTGCGTVSPDYVLERILGGVGQRWQLEVSADADTLVAELLEADGDSQTIFLFVYSETGPEADCFCD